MKRKLPFFVFVFGNLVLYHQNHQVAIRTGKRLQPW